MTTETIVRLVPFRCIGFYKDGPRIGQPCNHVLMKVPVEHMELVRDRIEIKCFHCRNKQQYGRIIPD